MIDTWIAMGAETREAHLAWIKQSEAVIAVFVFLLLFLHAESKYS